MQQSMGTSWFQYKIISLCIISMGTYWVQSKLIHYATFQWVLIGFNINCSFIMQQFNG